MERRRDKAYEVCKSRRVAARGTPSHASVWGAPRVLAGKGSRHFTPTSSMESTSIMSVASALPMKSPFAVGMSFTLS